MTAISFVIGILLLLSITCSILVFWLASRAPRDPSDPARPTAVVIVLAGRRKLDIRS